jgi:non-ribosomal peptide synthetase component F
MTADEAADFERLEKASGRFQALAERAEAFASRLPEIGSLVEERERRSSDAEEGRWRRSELNREIGTYYAAWRELVAEARAAAGALAGVLPAHEVEAYLAQVSETAVGATFEALVGVLRRLEEFLAARPKRRATVPRPAERLEEPSRAGRWVTAAEYAAFAGVSVQTLANWRWQDRKAGRDGPAPGKPLYRRFGRAVRYFLAEPG